MKQKKYWLRFGSAFFVIFLVLSIYASFIVSQNTIHIYRTGEVPPIDIAGLLYFIPGFSSLISFAYGGPIGLIVGVIILSLLYGLVGAIIGGVYGKIKSRNVA